MTVRKEQRPDGTTRIVRRATPESEWQRKEVPAIVKPDVWRRAQAHLAANTSANSHPEKRSYLLTGFITCGACGKPLRPRRSHGKLVYRCISKDRAGQSCRSPQVPVDFVEWAAWQTIADTLADEGRTRALFAARQGGPDPEFVQELAARRQGLETLAKRERRLIAAFLSDDDEPDAVVRQEHTKIKAQRRELAETITTLERQIAAATEQAQGVENFLEFSCRYRDELATMPFADRRKFLRELRAGVVVRGEWVRVFSRWEVPDDIPESWCLPYDDPWYVSERAQYAAERARETHDSEDSYLDAGQRARSDGDPFAGNVAPLSIAPKYDAAPPPIG
jgi:hypothetical protein